MSQDDSLGQAIDALLRQRDNRIRRETMLRIAEGIRHGVAEYESADPLSPRGGAQFALIATAESIEKIAAELDV